MKGRPYAGPHPRKRGASLAAACAVALSGALGSCDVFGALSAPDSSDSALVRFLEPASGTIDLSLYASDPGRSAYVVVTTGASSSWTAPAASQTAGSRVSPAGLSPRAHRNRGASERASEIRRAGFRSFAESFVASAAPRYASTGDAPADAVGDSVAFTLYGDATGSTVAVCRYVSGDVVFGDRTRSLSIWVPESEWSTIEGVDGTVSPAKVDALAGAFFNPGGDTGSSIYAWVTAMLGDEWGTGGSVRYGVSTFDVIGDTRNITILIADIEDDGDDLEAQGGVIGYFYPGDTIPEFQYSNERVMFAIDSAMLGTKEGASWDIGDYWPSTVISTLAHEFQHMIHFYQKAVLRGGDYFSEPTWIDELCSMQVEDLIADKIKVADRKSVRRERV